MNIVKNPFPYGLYGLLVMSLDAHLTSLIAILFIRVWLLAPNLHWPLHLVYHVILVINWRFGGYELKFLPSLWPRLSTGLTCMSPESLS